MDSIPFSEDAPDHETRPRPIRPEIVVPGKLPLDEKLSRLAIPWYTEDQLQNPFALKPNYIDTTLVGFQMYDFAAQDGYFYAQKGNVGHVHRPLRFSMDLSPGIKLTEYDIYGGYFFHHDDIKYYRPKHVFTELFYLTGWGREQLFHGKHAQKLHETLHAGFQYRVVNSPGTLSRIGARNSDFYFTADFLSPDNRYQVLANVISSRVRNMESGGLNNHEQYEENPQSETVFLNRAESRAREFSINLRHFYQTGFYTRADTSGQSRFINFGRINHNFTYKQTSFVYDDKDVPPNHYDYILLDSISTYDSTAVHRIENLVSWSNFPLSSGRGTFPFNFRLYLQHSINTIKQPNFIPAGAPLENEENERIYYHSEGSFNEIVQGAELQSDQRKFLSFGGFANVTLGGYHDEDLHSGAFLNFGKADRNYNLQLKLRYSLTEAPYFYNNISVNNISWENNFNKMQIVNLGARLHFPFITIEGNYFLLDNIVYLGQNKRPVQNNYELGLFSLGAYSEIKAGNFGFRNHLLFQKTTSDNFSRFPAVISYHSAYFNFSVFDGSLVNQFGFDFHYNTGYRAMAYLPAIRGFYLQDEYTMRDKYLLDFFWNGKISNARLFIKFQNILGLIIKNEVHYDIPFYPISRNNV
jgi:hypothetical protein